MQRDPGALVPDRARPAMARPRLSASASRSRIVDGRRALGASGEQIAERHVLGLGWRVEARNARTRWGEIDLVCRDAQGYVFVEVKTRRASSFVAPEEAATGEKLRRLARLGAAWLALRGERQAQWRLVIAAVSSGDAGPSVLLIDVDRRP